MLCGLGGMECIEHLLCKSYMDFQSTTQPSVSDLFSSVHHQWHKTGSATHDLSFIEDLGGEIRLVFVHDGSLSIFQIEFLYVVRSHEIVTILR
jgi:hypothetical protein